MKEGTYHERSRIFQRSSRGGWAPTTHAIDCGNLVFLSGQVPLVPETGALAEGGVEGQARQMFANIKAVLSSCGMTFDNVVKTTVFMTDLADFTTFGMNIYAEYFPENPRLPVPAYRWPLSPRALWWRPSASASSKEEFPCL